MSSVNHFLELKCAGDVLNSVYPFLNPEKEISESMAIIKRIKKILVTNPDTYTIFDLCAGNCLTSSLITHLFKIKHIYAIDKADRDRPNFSKIKNFTYVQGDIIENKNEHIEYIKMSNPSIIISIHPCSELAQEVIDIYKKSEADYLIMMPCCEGVNTKEYPNFIKDKLSKYELWCLDLCNLSNGNGKIDNQCMSNKNIIIFSKKEGL